MHELSLAQELVTIIEQVAAEHDARRVVRARIEVGELTCVEPAAISFAFEVSARGTVAEGCALEIVPVALRVRCPRCAREGPVAADDPSCPACGQVSLQVVSGREIRLLSIEAEREDDADRQDSDRRPAEAEAEDEEGDDA